MGRGHSPIPDPQWEGRYPLPTHHPPRGLRHLDPSHSKILGTPLALNIYLIVISARHRVRL